MKSNSLIPVHCCSGYLSSEKKTWTVRVRLVERLISWPRTKVISPWGLLQNSSSPLQTLQSSVAITVWMGQRTLQKIHRRYVFPNQPACELNLLRWYAMKRVLSIKWEQEIRRLIMVIVKCVINWLINNMYKQYVQSIQCSNVIKTYHEHFTN